MKKTTLLIMAAGIGSRFGGGIKQLEPVGDHGEIIMDFSIHDAIEAGFRKIIFVIRKDIETDFREMVEDRVSSVCSSLGVDVTYAFQELQDLPEGFGVPNGRTKPWGTGQAILAAKKLIQGPFAAINADDFYGKESFRKVHDWLMMDHDEAAICMAGFILKNTLSDHGSVTRGVCKVSEDGIHLCNVVETRNIIKTTDPLTGEIKACVKDKSLDPNSLVSMNFWGFASKEGDRPEILRMLEREFLLFLQNQVPADPLKAEYLLPDLIGRRLREGKCSVEALETRDTWFGVTYKEDKKAVMESLRKLIQSGFYKENLYSDLLKS